MIEQVIYALQQPCQLQIVAYFSACRVLLRALRAALVCVCLVGLVSLFGFLMGYVNHLKFVKNLNWIYANDMISSNNAMSQNEPK